MAELTGQNAETLRDHTRRLCGQDIVFKLRDGQWCATVNLGKQGYCRYEARHASELVREIVRDLSWRKK